MSKAITELASIIKNNGQVKPAVESTAAFAVYIGIVEIAPPEIQVRLNEAVILYKENLIISAAALQNYEREFEIYDAEIQFTDSNCGQTAVASNHSHTIQALNVNSSTLRAKGKIKWTDELAIGDKVILVPTQSEDLYILVEKAVEL